MNTKSTPEGIQPTDLASASAQGFRDGYASAMLGDPAPLGNGGAA